MATSDSTPTKLCRKCGRELPATTEYFHEHQGSLKTPCKDCKREFARLRLQDPERREQKREYHRQWEQNNRDRVRGYQQKRKDLHRERDRAAARRDYHRNRDVRLEKQKRYRETNPEKIKAKHRRYYDANREKVLESQRTYRKGNPEKIREYQRMYRQYNFEKVSDSQKRWRRAHPEKQREYGRRYAEAHPERRAKQYRESNKRYKKNHPDRVRLQWRNVNARRRGAAGTHSTEDVLVQLKRQKGRCYYCGEKVGDTYHVEHVVPLSRGGSNDPDNIVIACLRCNLSKSDRMPHEWPEGGRLL